jgi:hypothetical protein
VESSRKIIQSIRLAGLAGIVFLALITSLLAPYANANPIILGALTFLAVGDVGVVYCARRIMVARSESALFALPEDPRTLARWRTGYLVIYAVSASIAVYGVMLHVLGFAFSQALPFFIAGFALTLFFSPRRRVESR